MSFPTCPFIFTGQRFDPETLLDYYKRRYYLVQWGRFLSRDRSDGPRIPQITNGSFGASTGDNTAAKLFSGAALLLPVRLGPFVGGRHLDRVTYDYLEQDSGLASISEVRSASELRLWLRNGHTDLGLDGNLFRYVVNNPPNALDPTGRDVYVESTAKVGGWHERITVDVHNAQGQRIGWYAISFGYDTQRQCGVVYIRQKPPCTKLSKLAFLRLRRKTCRSVCICKAWWVGPGIQGAFAKSLQLPRLFRENAEGDQRRAFQGKAVFDELSLGSSRRSSNSAVRTK